ncbi:PKD domain-containing protein [Saccharicrinis sp. FJH62]|uniref:PKD domain-containing protein n=1 Tax=Saccharicrinis sp. FJH62 TaxID=3344657 RepID=UPI0035D510B7
MKYLQLNFIKLTLLFVLMIAVMPFSSCDKKTTEDICMDGLSPKAVFEYSRFKCDDGTLQCVQFQNMSEDTSPETVYYWSFGDGKEGDDENPVHSYFHPGTYHVVLKVINCNGTISFHKDSVTVYYD